METLNDRIKNLRKENNLTQTCYDIIEQLKPLYELVIWKRGNR